MSTALNVIEYIGTDKWDEQVLLKRSRLFS